MTANYSFLDTPRESISASEGGGLFSRSAEPRSRSLVCAREVVPIMDLCISPPYFTTTTPKCPKYPRCGSLIGFSASGSAPSAVFSISSLEFSESSTPIAFYFS